MVDNSTVCWLDYSGSGSETAAHILDNGRLTILFVAFEGPPKIVRLYGHASFILPDDLVRDPSHQKIKDLFQGELPGQPDYDPGFRCVVVLRVTRASHSCGYSIPRFEYVGERSTLKEFSRGKGSDAMVAYRGRKNSYSIDGLPSIGRILMGRWPEHVALEEGYFMSTYEGGEGEEGDKGLAKGVIGWGRRLAHRAWTAGRMAVLAGVVPAMGRDLIIVGAGAVLGSLSTLIFIHRLKSRHA